MSGAERYRAAGVDLDAADDAKRRLRSILESARSELAVGAVDAFGGMIRLPSVSNPVLVISTDSVGTKVLVALRANRHDTLGEDLVNHCVNDILVQGARPLAFVDYIAAPSIDPVLVSTIVEGVGRACRAHDMTLAGGETAILPDLYRPDVYDFAGTIVGVVAQHDLVTPDSVNAGDVLIGFASSGLHTNGYTLARRVLFDDLRLDIDSVIPDLGETVGEALLQIHRSYARPITPVLGAIHSLAHVTGGGIPGNLPRALPPGLGAVVDTASWDVPPLFTFLAEGGKIDRREMFRVFNMGIGLIAVVPRDSEDDLHRAGRTADIATWTLGEVVATPGVRLE